jgi:ribonuclease PH
MPQVEQQPPSLLAMIIADVVHADPATGKFSILGTYSAIGAASFPCTHPYMAVYLAITDGRGETPMKMRLIDVEEVRNAVFESEATLNFIDPTQVIELTFFQSAVVFPEPGEYSLQLFGAGEFLSERRVLVVPIQQPGVAGELGRG